MNLGKEIKREIVVPVRQPVRGPELAPRAPVPTPRAPTRSLEKVAP